MAKDYTVTLTLTMQADSEGEAASLAFDVVNDPFQNPLTFKVSGQGKEVEIEAFYDAIQDTHILGEVT